MVEIDAIYEGRLRCRVTHGPSGMALTTDAPTDHHGQGAAFSPIDLVAAAMSSCLLTVMGIVAQRHGLDLVGTRVHVTKEMGNTPTRRIGTLAVTVTFSVCFDESQRMLLERTARSCPVHHSLHPDLHAPITFVYPASL